MAAEEQKGGHMYYHASQTAGIKVLEPGVSNHGEPLVYFSRKRENTLVYLSNAVEKYCRETGFEHHGSWYKWASYGFTKDGILLLQEYYPDATYETYKGVSGYIYSTSMLTDGKAQADIPDAVIAGHPVPVENCEFIPDAYEAIMDAVRAGQMVLQRYGELSEEMLNWIRRITREEYEKSADKPEYRHFLEGKFPLLEEAI